MMKQRVLILVAVVCALPQCQSSAQWISGYGGGYGGGGGFVGTAFSAEEHGIADIVRSEGMYNQMTSQAMINYEEARGKYIDNEKKWVEFHLWRKKMAEAQRIKEQEEDMTSRARYAEYKAIHPDTPPRLSKNQLNHATGEIKWPIALQSNVFFTLRQDLEQLFETKAQSGLTSEISLGIKKKTTEMESELSNHLKEFVIEEFIQARKFLRSLPMEGRTPIETRN